MNEERAAYIAGRLEGLAGTTRYNLSAEDRRLLFEAADLLKPSDLQAEAEKGYKEVTE